MHFKEKFIPRVKIQNVKEINIAADVLVKKLLKLSETETVCFLDSCGVNHLGSHQLIAGLKPVELSEISNDEPEKTLYQFNKKLSNSYASIFTISYDFGLKLEKIKQRKKEFSTFTEPDIFIAIFDSLIIHDYNTQKTYLHGNTSKSNEIKKTLSNIKEDFYTQNVSNEVTKLSSNFTKSEYIQKVKEIQELIREGETYQTNLTQQFRAKLSNNLTPQQIFWNLRKNHPAPFASFIKRKNDFVLSISPERFVNTINNGDVKGFGIETQIIKTSPIKGTRPRGKNIDEDNWLKESLINSKKDRAENTMIVDLLRNDIGKVCEFGSVNVEKLCDLEEHPSLFHLVSTVSGKLNKKINYSDVIKAIFPCGSITGCPKIRTMQIIDKIETVNRGLSMGAIGYACSDNSLSSLDLSVAIRTMVISKDVAIFNVGGGIVIDSIPKDEYEESLTKAKALFNAIGIKKF